MLQIIKNRLAQGYRTIRFPAGEKPILPPRYRGRPFSAELKSETDLGRITFAPDTDIKYSNDFSMAATRREDLLAGKGKEPALARVLEKEMLRVFGRSLQLRQVSAGGCNACELDINVLNTPVYDLSRFGIRFTASPRHADGILVTGPVTRNMKEALLKTWEAVPEPKIVIAVGACAISGGLFADSPEASQGLDTLVPVDLFIPGCPPHPLTILDGLLRLLGRM